MCKEMEGRYAITREQVSGVLYWTIIIKVGVKIKNIPVYLSQHMIAYHKGKNFWGRAQTNMASYQICLSNDWGKIMYVKKFLTSTKPVL